jgi:hypothetical protein
VVEVENQVALMELIFQEDLLQEVLIILAKIDQEEQPLNLLNQEIQEHMDSEIQAAAEIIMEILLREHKAEAEVVPALEVILQALIHQDKVEQVENILFQVLLSIMQVVELEEDIKMMEVVQAV